MVGRSLDANALPGNALEVFNGANRNALGIHDGTLLNVQFDECIGFDETGITRSAVPNTSQFIPQDGSIGSYAVKGFVKG